MNTYTVEIDRQGKTRIFTEPEYVHLSGLYGGMSTVVRRLIGPKDNNQLYNRLQLADDIINAVPEDYHLGEVGTTYPNAGIAIELIEDKPTKGWKWLQAQPVGTHLMNSGGAKFTIEEDGLCWYKKDAGSSSWKWNGSSRYSDGDWRTRDWVVNASEETCKTWEEPVKLTGKEFLQSLELGTTWRLKNCYLSNLTFLITRIGLAWSDGDIWHWDGRKEDTRTQAKILWERPFWAGSIIKDDIERVK